MKLSRRSFMKGAAVVGVLSLNSYAAENVGEKIETTFLSEDAYQKARAKDGYGDRTQIPVYIEGIEKPVVLGRIRTRDEEWNKLPEELTIEQLTGELAKMENIQYEMRITMHPKQRPWYAKGIGYHPHPISDQDLVTAFLDEADIHLATKPEAACGVPFETGDKTNIGAILTGGGLRSSVIRNIANWWETEEDGCVFPTDSRIIIGSQLGKGSIQVYTKVDGGFDVGPVTEIVDEGQPESLRKMLMRTVLNKPESGDIPMTGVYISYKTGTMAEVTIGLGEDKGLAEARKK